MNEFLDIYRLYAKNFQKDLSEETWSKEDIDRLRRSLEKIGSKIENGLIVVNALKRDIDTFPDATLVVFPLMNIRDTVFEIETLLYHKDQEIEENIEERKKEEKKLELERKKSGEWLGILGDEKPVKKYGTIGIYSSIKDYIWDNLPTDFKHNDVKVLFKKFYEEKLGRKLKDSSYGTYAGTYIRFYKDLDPPIISWVECDYSKDVDKYKTEDKELEIKEEKVKKVTDTNTARDEMLKSSKQNNDRELTTDEIMEDELAKDESSGGILTERTKKLLSEEQEIDKIEKLEEEDKRIEPELVKPKINNPFNEGSAEQYLYRIAVESNWTGFKKGTPLIMVMKRMAEFSKDEIKNAINIMVKRRKARRVMNNFIEFYE